MGGFVDGSMGEKHVPGGIVCVGRQAMLLRLLPVGAGHSRAPRGGSKCVKPGQGEIMQK